MGRMDIGRALAIWHAQERDRLRKVNFRAPAPPRPALVLHTPPVEHHIVQIMGERYRDFMIVRAAVISGQAEWIVHHVPSKKQGRVVLDLITAQTLPYSDFGKWFYERAKVVADAILETTSMRTM